MCGKNWLGVVIVVGTLLVGPPVRVGGQATTRSAPAGEALALDFSDPTKAFESYLKAQKKFDFKALKECVWIGPPEQAARVDIFLTYNLWQNYLERAAVAKYGVEQGMTVLGHLRTYEQQIDVDLKRLPLANVDPEPGNADRATLFLKPEKNPIPDYKTEDTFYFRRVGGLWKLDYVRTYDLANAERAEELKNQEILYPRIAKAFKKLSEEVKANKYRKAEDVKGAVAQAWDNALAPEGPPATNKTPP